MNFLETMVAKKREEVAQHKRNSSRMSEQRAVNLKPLDFAAAVRRPGLAIIAEIKRKSPSRGVLRTSIDVPALASCYRRGGAAAISVLTDPVYFGAQPTDLQVAKQAAGLPTLRKDFIIDAFQLHEARSIGADAVLLIAAILSRTQLAEFLVTCSGLQLSALVEVHDEAELETAVSSGGLMIGVNNRDLRTLQVDPDRCYRLKKYVPKGCLAVAESGIAGRGDVARLEEHGFDAVLVGKALMTAPDPLTKLFELRGCGEAAEKPSTNPTDMDA